MENAPAHLPPHRKPPFVIFCYKNFGAMCNISHIGLGVTAINCSKYLIQKGIRSEVWPVLTHHELILKLSQAKDVTHVIIGALFIPTHFLAAICRQYPQIAFAVNCHSNMGFLQAEPNAIKLIRESLDLEQGTHNFHTACNSQRLCHWIQDAYNAPASYLPNLYYLDDHSKSYSPLWSGGVLRLGVFGSSRVYKNFTCSVAAGIEIAHATKAQTEIWVNSNRSENGGNVVRQAAVELTRNVPGIELKFYPWSTWPEFRRFVRSMHLLLQPSYTESFNNTTADGAAEGVPCVVSSAITWAPSHWVADCDDVMDIARVGKALITDHHAARDGLKALQDHNAKSFLVWKSYIESTMLP